MPLNWCVSDGAGPPSIVRHFEPVPTLLGVLVAAVGETVILLTPPDYIPIGKPNEGTGGCHQMTVSPMARC